MFTIANGDGHLLFALDSRPALASPYFPDRFFVEVDRSELKTLEVAGAMPAVGGGGVVATHSVEM